MQSPRTAIDDAAREEVEEVTGVEGRPTNEEETTAEEQTGVENMLTLEGKFTVEENLTVEDDTKRASQDDKDSIVAQVDSNSTTRNNSSGSEKIKQEQESSSSVPKELAVESSQRPTSCSHAHKTNQTISPSAGNHMSASQGLVNASASDTGTHQPPHSPPRPDHLHTPRPPSVPQFSTAPQVPNPAPADPQLPRHRPVNPSTSHRHILPLPRRANQVDVMSEYQTSPDPWFPTSPTLPQERIHSLSEDIPGLKDRDYEDKMQEELGRLEKNDGGGGGKMARDKEDGTDEEREQKPKRQRTNAGS